MGKRHSELDAHKETCDHRYGNINQQLTEIKNQMLAFHSDNIERMNALSNRMWALLVASLGGTVIGVSALVFYLLVTRPHA
jgi:hypothetical protein